MKSIIAALLLATLTAPSFAQNEAVTYENHAEAVQALEDAHIALLKAAREAAEQLDLLLPTDSPAAQKLKDAIKQVEDAEAIEVSK